MIIEGAFLKLPELLLGHSFPQDQHEATLANHLAMEVLLELTARNIALPMHRIHLERPYPKILKSTSPGRSDLYVDLAGLFKGLWHQLYGMKPDNWIEAKFFGGIGRHLGTQPKTENAAMIALDLVRLCFFVQEEQSEHRDHGRYFLVVFNRNPKVYLSFQRRDANFPRREWLSTLLHPGQGEIHLSLEREPASFRKILAKGFTENLRNFSLRMKTTTLSFSPIEALSEYLYWGYLVRIVDFEISFDNDKLTYTDTSKDVWSKEKQETQERIAARLLELQSNTK